MSPAAATPGYGYQGAAGSETFGGCPANTYSAGGALNAASKTPLCASCPAFSTSPSAAATCTGSAGAGYSGPAGSETWGQCLAGAFSAGDVVNMTSKTPKCQQCPVGSSSAVGAGACTAIAGFGFSGASGSQVFGACPSGTFSAGGPLDQVAKTPLCSACPAGTTSSASGCGG